MNIVMNDKQQFIELQGTAEGHCFDEQELNHMMALAKSGIASIIEKQKQCLST
jgi:ribonuclease PH